MIKRYDLQADPLEHVNLAKDETHTATRDDLLRRLHARMRETHDPLLQGVPPSPMHLRAVAALAAA